MQKGKMIIDLKAKTIHSSVMKNSSFSDAHTYFTSKKKIFFVLLICLKATKVHFQHSDNMTENNKKIQLKEKSSSN